MNIPPFMVAVVACATSVAFSQDLPVPFHALSGETGGPFDSQGIERGVSQSTDARVTVFSDFNTLVPDDLFWAIQFECSGCFGVVGPFRAMFRDVESPDPEGAESNQIYWSVGEHGSGGGITDWLREDALAASVLSLRRSAVPVVGLLAVSVFGTLALLCRQRLA